MRREQRIVSLTVNGDHDARDDTYNSGSLDDCAESSSWPVSLALGGALLLIARDCALDIRTSLLPTVFGTVVLSHLDMLPSCV